MPLIPTQLTYTILAPPVPTDLGMGHRNIPGIFCSPFGGALDKVIIERPSERLRITIILVFFGEIPKTLSEERVPVLNRVQAPLVISTQTLTWTISHLEHYHPDLSSDVNPFKMASLGRELAG